MFQWKTTDSRILKIILTKKNEVREITPPERKPCCGDHDAVCAGEERQGPL